MKQARQLFYLTIIGLLLAACAKSKAVDSHDLEPCSPQWNLFVEKKLRTSDSQGHGPDIGSREWQSVIEFKLGIRGKADIPAAGSPAWCEYIDTMLRPI